MANSTSAGSGGAAGASGEARTQHPVGAFDRDLGLRMYRDMQRARRMEEAAAKVYTQGKIGGFCHLYIGQESVAAGSIHALEPTDHIISAYRIHAQAMMKGLTMREIMAELYGKATGSVQGMGGSMHFFDKEKRFYGGHGIVGGHVPLAAGIAFASKYRGEAEVTICYLGDGAANQGAFFEALQLAQLYELPVVFIVENNFYAMGTALLREAPIAEIELKAVGFGMAHDAFTDTDTFGVYERVGEAVRRAREESLPTLINLMTYRYRGHSMSDPAKYRTKDELAEWKQKDPIKVLAGRLQAEGGVTDEELAAIDREARAEVQDALDFADASPYPDISVATDYVYVQPTYPSADGSPQHG